MLLLRPSGDMNGATVVPGDPPDPGDPTKPPWPSWPLPLPPLPRRCIVREQGDGQTCQTAVTWKLSASFDCQNAAPSSGMGTVPTTGALHLEGIEVFGACGRGTGLYLAVRYFCCSDPNVIERFGASAPELEVAAPTPK